MDVQGNENMALVVNGNKTFMCERCPSYMH